MTTQDRWARSSMMWACDLISERSRVAAPSANRVRILGRSNASGSSSSSRGEATSSNSASPQALPSKSAQSPSSSRRQRASHSTPGRVKDETHVKIASSECWILRAQSCSQRLKQRENPPDTNSIRAWLVSDGPYGRDRTQTCSSYLLSRSRARSHLSPGVSGLQAFSGSCDRT